jgi:hypothetical protein
MFGSLMRDRPSKIDKWVWAEEDFREMSWHDVVIHGFATNNEMLSGPDEEPRFESQDLLFDIDYVLNWRESLVEGRAGFRISPATLVFAEVSDLNVNFRSESGPPLIVIYTIERKGRRWTISLNEGQISFDSAGFKQYIRREPVLKSHFTYLTDSERGGFSFRRAHD